mgnify:CR=1 FL=1
MPASRIATISSVVATGRRMNRRDGFTGGIRGGPGETAGGGQPPRSWRRWRRAARLRGVPDGGRLPGGRSPLPLRRPPFAAGAAWASRVINFDLGAFAQLVRAVDDDEIAGRRCPLAIAVTSALHRTELDWRHGNAFYRP